MRTRRNLYSLAALLLLGGIAFVAASAVVGSKLAAAVTVDVGPPPPGLPARELVIESPSGSRLAAWLATRPERPATIILLHPVRANRLAMAGRAEFLWAAGFNVLLFDFQAHGESPGRRITFGHLEARDARAALALVREQLPDKPVGVLGVSLGGAAALLGDGPLDADAIVLEAVYSSVEQAVFNRVEMRLGPAAHLLAPALLVQLRPRLGIAPAELRPIERIGRLRAPLLLIAGEADRHTTLEESRRMFEAAPEPKELWVVAGAAHIDFHRHARAEYQQRVLEFFNRTLVEASPAQSR